MIAAFPPPVSGQSLAAKLLYDGLSPDEFDVFKLDLAEPSAGDTFLRRLYQLAGIEVKLISLCIREPELLLMDEPLSHLDGKARQAMRTEIKRLINKIKCTTVYVTHDQLEAMSLADKIAIINFGVLQQFGTPT